MATKKGFVEVFVMRVTPIGPAAPPEAPGAVLAAVPPLEQAASISAVVARADRLPSRFPWEWITWVSSLMVVDRRRFARFVWRPVSTC
jgi:hypothetical protein